MFLPGQGQGQCINMNRSYALLQLFNVVDVATDFGLATLPCIMIWNLTIPKAKKIGVSILLGVAALYVFEFPRALDCFHKQHFSNGS